MRGDTFKLIYTIGEIVDGPILNIGNPNARVKLARPLHEVMEDWCQEGPSHHIAMGYGDHSQALETFAEAIGFEMCGFRISSCNLPWTRSDPIRASGLRFAL